ncbi:MAG: hypothetical protein HY260_02470 [Chloroflexi bacterium]|nr:hypothetical protein [Chloroflexota bacterium]
MPITYTNRKGVTYYLHQGTTKKGKPRYFFSKESTGQVLDRIPDGYEITESVNGIVSLSKAGQRTIAESEVGLVASIVTGQRHLKYYRVAAKRNTIEVYEPLGGLDDKVAARIFGDDLFTPALAERLRRERAHYTHYSPVMRFILEDETERTFSVERWCYRGSTDGWLPIYSAGAGPLGKLARRCIPHLGKDSFFELI